LYRKIQFLQMKGVPGVDQGRLEEAFTIRHCALSLVGEPIIYPYINEFIELLHSKNISSFLVTNAQFPDKIVISNSFSLISRILSSLLRSCM
jgi:tRNA wybutosine-synthesizing protein 1